MIHTEVAIVLFLSIVIFYLLNHYYRDIVGFYYNEILKKNKMITRDEFITKYEFLSTNITFFRGLSDKAKADLVNYMWEFNRSKTFIFEGGSSEDESTKLFIAASASIFNYGFEDHAMNACEKIIVHSGNFFDDEIEIPENTADNEMHIAWTDIKEGFSFYNEKYNFGFHEVLRALKSFTSCGDIFDEELDHYYQDFKEGKLTFFHEMNYIRHSVLEDEKFKTREDFFALCLVHFFDYPEEFKAKAYELYVALCVLMNQDPLKVLTDYKVPEKYVEKYPRLVNENKKRPSKTWHWTLTVMLLGIISTIPLFIGFELVLINGLSITFLWLGVALVAAVIHYKTLVGNKVMSKFFYYTYCLIGPAPVFLAATLWLSILIPIGINHDRVLDSKTYQYVEETDGYVINYLSTQRGWYFYDHEIKLTGKSASELDGSVLHMKTRRGLFGFEVKGPWKILTIDGKELS